MRAWPTFPIVLAALGLLITNALAWEKGKPNVVLIVTDDQGYGDLGCHGNPILRTPNLDRLYAQSIRFTNFHTDPTCSPTRSALMTGRYATRVGVWHTVMGRHMPRRDEVMMPQVFAAGGYQTAIYGKWHLGDNYPYRPQDRGFQEVLIHGGGGIGQIPDYWGNDYFDDTYLHNGHPKSFTGYCTDVFFREAMQFIRKNVQRPFFVYLATNAPHSPFRVPERYSRPYADLVEGDQGLAQFYGMIANIDDNVGRMMQLLDETGLADRTILLFMTDNGTSRGATFTDNRGNEGKMLSGYNAGMRGRKGSPYEGGHRVPCFVRWPGGGLSAGRDIEVLTAHLDLLPTLIELCGLEAPGRYPLDGRSLVPLLSNQPEGWPDRILFAHHQELPIPEKWRFCSVMTRRWRLINGGQLYDISVDPGQQTDLSQHHREVVRQLRDAYENWWRDISTRFDAYAEIELGTDRQDPLQLTCFEWHSSQRWSQSDIRSGFEGNGFWALNIAAEGTYEFVLRRWPPELDAAITAAVDGGKAIDAARARIRIGDIEQSAPLADGASQVRFNVRLQPGKTRLKTWFIDSKGHSRGAYFVTAGRRRG